MSERGLRYERLGLSLIDRIEEGVNQRERLDVFIDTETPLSEVARRRLERLGIVVNDNSGTYTGRLTKRQILGLRDNPWVVHIELSGELHLVDGRRTGSVIRPLLPGGGF